MNSHHTPDIKIGQVWASPFLVISMWTSSVCLSVCHGRQLTVNHFRLLFCAFCVMH